VDVRRGVAVACALVAACSTNESVQRQAVTQCPTDTVEGVDVYTGDGAIDWAKVAGSGRKFAFIKATQGNYNTQATFETNWNDSLSNGLYRSPYHFFDGTIDGVTQANWFLDELNSVGGLQEGDLAPMLDIECPTSSSQSAASPNCEYTGDSGWVASATLQSRIFDWLDTVQAATGRKPIIYSYVSWFASVGVTDTMLATYPLYIASYNACPSIPAPWTQTVFWQYSASGTVPGITPTADLDRFMGTADQLAGMTGQIDAGIGGDAELDDAADAGSATETGGKGGCGCGASVGAGGPLTALLGAGLVAVLVRRRKLSTRKAKIRLR